MLGATLSDSQKVETGDKCWRPDIFKTALASTHLSPNTKFLGRKIYGLNMGKGWIIISDLEKIH
jgi:hypothetical protein